MCFRIDPGQAQQSKSTDCIINHIHIVHISYGAERELKTARPSRERCVYLSGESVWLCSGLKYGWFSMHGRKCFQTTLSTLTKFHA